MDNTKKFVCGKCNHTFQQSAGLSRHKKNCSFSNPKLYRCNTCIKTFTRNDSLMKHINKGRCRPQGFFPCNECEKIFKSSWYLKRHLHVHEPKNVYKCENCKKTYFRRKSYLKHKWVNDILHINVSSLTNRENVAEHHLPSDIEQSSIDEIDAYESDENVEIEITVDEFPSMIDFHKDNDMEEEIVDKVVPLEIDEVVHADETDQVVPTSSFSEDVLKELRNHAALRKMKSRVADKVAQLIIVSQFQSNDDELDTMILSLKKLDLLDKMKEKFNKYRKTTPNTGRKRTPLHTCNQVWKFWHENATTSTITSRPAKLKINNQPKLQSGLPFIDTVELVKTGNVDNFQSQWLILNKT